MSNAISIKSSTVTIPRQLKDKTLPWPSKMLDLASKAQRKDSLEKFVYVFKQTQDARDFYVDLLTKPEARLDT